MELMKKIKNVAEEKARREHTERAERMEQVMEAVSQIEGFEVEDILSSMLDSLNIELSDLLNSSDEEDLTEGAFKLSQDIIELVTENMRVNECENVLLSTAKATMATAMAFSTAFRAFDSIIKGELDEVFEDIEELVENDNGNEKLEYIKELYDRKILTNEGLATMLEEGELSLNDIDTLFGSEVASTILKIATKNFESKKPSKTSKSLDEELKSFEKLKEEVSKGKVSYEQFSEIMQGYSNEAVAEILKDAEKRIASISDTMGVSKELIKGILNII